MYFLLLIKQPNAEIIIDNINYQVTNGDLIVLTPFNIRFIDIPINRVEGHVIGFSESFYSISQDHRNFLFETLAVLNTPIYPLSQSTEIENSFIESIFMQVFVTYQQIEDNQQQINCRIVRALVNTLVLYVRKRESNPPQRQCRPPSHKQTVIQFLKLLNEHYNEQSSVKFYTEQLAITEVTLKKHCKIRLGITPKEVIQRKIIAEAKRLLINDNISVQEIACFLGYSEPTNFNKFFLKRTGVTPRQFRLQEQRKN